MKKIAKKTMKQSNGDLIFDVVNYFLVSIITMLFIYPLIFFVSASISDPDLVWRGEMWLLPKGITFEGYQRIFADSSIWVGYKNTIIYTFVGTILNLFMTIIAAYPLSVKNFYIKNHLMFFYSITMFISGGMIPTYLLVKDLGMLNSIWALILPGAVGLWNVIIVRTYFQTNIPNELREATAIDGCGNIGYLLKFVLPLSAPILAVMTLFYGVGHWNSFFSALIYITDKEMYPLQLILREILVQSQVSQASMNMSESIESVKTMAKQREIAESIKYGVIIVSTLPVLIAYPFIQKHFVKGIMVGSIKG